MKKLWTKYSHLLRNAVLTFGMCGFVLSPFSHPPVAQAQVGEIAGGLAACIGLGKLIGAAKDSVTTAAAAISVPVADYKVGFNTSDIRDNTADVVNKECSLDTIALAAARVLSERITDSVVAYINSGFNGSPSFITDPSAFFKDIGDDVVGELIYGTDLGFLCSPFQDLIRSSIKIKYMDLSGNRNRFQDKVRCSLGDIEGNIDDFVNGNFENGSLNDLFTISQVPQNNTLGTFIEVSGELDKRLASALNIKEGDINRNNGFLSVTNKDGEVVTPGLVIEEQLQKVLGQSVDQLNLADEFNEILGALVTQLTNKVFSGNGLISF